MSVRLMHGDCLELMKGIEPGSVDLVLTDPPYGIDFQSVRKKDKTKRFAKIKNDKTPFLECVPVIPLIIKQSGGCSSLPVGTFSRASLMLSSKTA